jgi:single-stranded DNA-binding protein
VENRNGDWQRRTTWHRIVGWNAVGESMLRNLARGTFVLLRGSIRNYDVPATGGGARLS